MCLSVKVMKELRTELVGLRASQARVKAQIEAIELLLSDKKPLNRASPRASLRARILAALENRSHGTAAEITATLASQGVTVGGNTTLRERVAHELSRLRRGGQLRRTRDGAYEHLPQNRSRSVPSTVGVESDAVTPPTDLVQAF